MKTIFKSAIVALALAVSVSASANAYMFNTNLRQGMRGADVTALQTRLGVTPATGFFGPLTRNAVRAYQTANGVPSTGFVGPMTREKLNATTSTTPTTPTTPTSPVVLNGMEGFAEYRLSPQPVNNTNVQVSNDVAVYGVEVKAKNADISFERLTLDTVVQNTVTGSYENPATLINSITVKDGSTVLATMPVNSSTFSKITGSFAYTVQLTGLSTRVAKDTIKTFTVHFNTNSIDSARQVTLSVSSNGARVVDGRGISTYNQNQIGERVHTFKKPGNSTLTVRSDATTIYSSNNRINHLSNGAEKVLTSTFSIKSESGPSKITDVVVTAATGTVASTMPVNLYLFQGSTLLDSRTVPASGIVAFDIDNSNVMVNEDQSVTFTVKADMPATTAQGSLVKTAVTTVIFDRADGSSSTIGSLNIDGPFHFFARVVPTFTKTSSSISVVNNQNGIGVSATADIRLNLTAVGGDIRVSETLAVIGLKNASTNAVVATTSVNVVPNDSALTFFPDGGSRAVTLSATFASSSISTTTNLKAFVQSIRYATATGATVFTLPGGFEPFDSDNSAVFNK